MFAIGLVVAVSAIVASLRMRSAYVDAVVDAVRTGVSDVLSAPQPGVVAVDGEDGLHLGATW